MKRKTVELSIRILLSTAIISAFLAGASSCKKSSKSLTPVTCDGSNPTYESTVKTIVNNNCVSCHSGYSTYSGLSSILENGQFKQHVITDQDMPENNKLSSDQLNTIQCWIEGGFKEK